MRSFVLVSLLGLLTVTGVAIGTTAGAPPEAPPDAAQARSGVAAAVQQQVRDTVPALTVRIAPGRRVKVGGRDFANTVRRVATPVWARVPQSPDHRVVQVNGRKVGVKESTPEEGRLVRLHVDAADAGPGETPVTVCIGFYETIDSEAALTTARTYTCKKCGNIIVCGVEPACF